MTSLRWREHPAARAEYLDALTWYEEQEAGLGSRLADALDGAVDLIRAWPNATAPYAGGPETGLSAVQARLLDGRGPHAAAEAPQSPA